MLTSNGTGKLYRERRYDGDMAAIRTLEYRTTNATTYTPKTDKNHRYFVGDNGAARIWEAFRRYDLTLLSLRCCTGIHRGAEHHEPGLIYEPNAFSMLAGQENQEGANSYFLQAAEDLPEAEQARLPDVGKKARWTPCCGTVC